MPLDRITLTAPARGEYARTVRMAAATLGSRLNMTYDEVDDLRMAAEEAFIYAVDGMAEGGEVTVSFAVGDRTIEIEVDLGDGAVAAGAIAQDRTELANLILNEVCDRHEFVSDESGHRMLRLMKCAENIDAH